MRRWAAVVVVFLFVGVGCGGGADTWAPAERPPWVVMAGGLGDEWSTGIAAHADHSTVAVGEAEPEDLFYSRAESFGDDYVVWTETDTGTIDPNTVCYPTVAYGDEKIVGTPVEGSFFCNEFDRMNTGGDTHSSEATLEANPDGSKL